MLAVQPDYLFDLHEGYDFHKLNKESVGQSIIYYPVGDGASVAKAMQAAVNRGIANKNHRFSLLKYPVKGSLARAAGLVLGTRAMILETSRAAPGHPGSTARDHGAGGPREARYALGKPAKRSLDRASRAIMLGEAH